MHCKRLVATSLQQILLPAALRAAQACRYLIYSEADFDFRFCTDGGESWSPPPCQISPPSVQHQGVGPPKLKFLLIFYRNVEYKRPAGAYPFRDFHNICSICTAFQGALDVKFFLDLLKGL